MTCDDILAFLNRLRKTEEEDRKHKWIGTYGLNIGILSASINGFTIPLLNQSKGPYLNRCKMLNHYPVKNFQITKTMNYG
jgi:hypothetical protein